MKKLILLIASTLVCTYSAADDTEIYGATAIDSKNRVNPNVLLIVDTSGSMGSMNPISYFDKPFDNSLTYNGKYDTDRFFTKTDSRQRDGISLSRLKHSSSGCSSELEKLSKNGFITGKFQTYWNQVWYNDIGDWGTPIRCNTEGKSATIYTGNYLNYYHDDSNLVETTRMEAVKGIVSDLTRSLSNVNLGLMRFDGAWKGGNGGSITVAIDDIETTGSEIRSSVNSFDPYWGTPLSETLYEAHLYFAGKTVKYGDGTVPKSVDSSLDNTDSSKYQSPIEQQCQKNHVIYLTDGEPSEDTGVNTTIKNMIKNLDLPSGLASNCKNHGTLNVDGDDSGLCLDELAYYMATVDQSSTQPGIQVVNTHVINAFGDIEVADFLEDTAFYGGGGYYEAEDPSGVADAINSIFLQILSTDSTFTAPAISVNAFNNSEHRDELFYALFKPNDKAKWNGNLKKYRLGEDGKIYDKNGSLAIDASTGFFSSSSQDFWSKVSGEDGKDVTLGGVANLLDPAKRTLYSDTSSGTLSLFDNVASETTLGVNSDNLDTLKKWIKGYDVKVDPGESRYYIGDPLHSEPVVVTYGGTDAKPDSTIYFGTNEGFIHAINTETGEEEFAFMPRDLHGIQDTLYQDNTPAGSRPYGMDGPISTWMYDLNSNNVIYTPSGSLETGEHAYLYAGMRRGGSNYYALDVTNRDSPKMLFTIEGGQGDFERLGQTWSEMTVAKVKYNGTSRFVAFFAGGYDSNQDSNDTREDDDFGNAVYMVDAKTGERLWWASNSDANLNITDMKNSMPASISAVDITGDGHVNYFFAVDTGGRVFRFDIKPDNKGANDFAAGGMIAELAGSSTTDNRRFYNKPSVAIVKDKDVGDYLTIGVGSGHRAHPILTKDVENRFYMIKDFNPYKKPATYASKTEAAADKNSLGDSEQPDKNKIYNATDLMTKGEAVLTSDMKRIMSQGGGWYVSLNVEGEKVLAQATTFSGAVIFTTFSPSNKENSGPCSPDTGISRVYALDQRWAMAAVDLNNDGKIDVNDASKILTNSGIAPRPVVIYRKGGGKSITLGTESIDDSRFKQESTEQCNANNCYVTPNYWRENVLEYNLEDFETDTSTGED
ncbi:pilus assembly protein [Bermanella sp. R86510]|uniref:pilus assembly protein n=1 Tax=unclassified Bermanella TaxID=2627862 RepID=UPI0037C6B21C